MIYICWLTEHLIAACTILLSYIFFQRKEKLFSIHSEIEKCKAKKGNNVCIPFKGYFTKIEHNINTRNNGCSLNLPKPN